MTFAERELEERKVIERWIQQSPEIQLIGLSKIGSFASYDAAIIRNGRRGIVEIKLRSFHHNYYETAILEGAKIKRLKQIKVNQLEKNGLDIDIWYAAHYTDDVLCLWAIDNYSDTDEIDCPATSSGGYSNTVNKAVMKYQISTAEKIQLK